MSLFCYRHTHDLNSLSSNYSLLLCVLKRSPKQIQNFKLSQIIPSWQALNKEKSIQHFCSFTFHSDVGYRFMRQWREKEVLVGLLLLLYWMNLLISSTSLSSIQPSIDPNRVWFLLAIIFHSLFVLSIIRMLLGVFYGV